MKISVPYYFIASFIFLLLLMGCENKSDNELSIQLTPDYLKGKSWVLVDNKGKVKTENYQKSKLVFLNEDEYEIHKIFEYSGSTFRSPGTYKIKDSMIQFRSINGLEKIGVAHIIDENRLQVEWEESDIIYGEGIELFQTISTEF
jgi:hypothetical protein